MDKKLAALIAVIAFGVLSSITIICIGYQRHLDTMASLGFTQVINQGSPGYHWEKTEDKK